ncbi:motility protein A [Occultella glacieicola]|uniref:Motility protein A n=1 Tax=Occultella glacieicola TaxID=2518684 RepID=A0ABY2E9N6_9MICO|nr:MotA/TolQ/ExbB proton channel family protein [Occultella glacieicola]TDE98646.1 motility protein A [Occultella glacieicola]
MDPATLIGILLAFGALLGMVTLEGASLTSLLLPAPILLVVGATIMVTIAGGTLADTGRAAKGAVRAIRGKPVPPNRTITTLVELSEKARNDGLLSMESMLEEVDDPFLREAFQAIVDGMDSEELRQLLEDKLDTKSGRDRQVAKFYSDMGGYAPTIGIVGTVVSLVHVLEYLSEPATLGPSIAAAFVATLWGVMTANFLWLPISNRLKRLSDLECDRMTLVIEGALAVQGGLQTRALDERLRALVPDDLPQQKEKAA